MNALWSAVVALGTAGVAWADDDKTLPKTLSDGERRMLEMEERLQLLESRLQESDEVRRLREQAEKEKREELDGVPGRVSALEKKLSSAGQTWDASKMLSFASPDGNFTMKIGGRFYFVYRHILDRDDDDGGAENQFVIDTARLTVDGSFYKDFIYKIEMEAAKFTDNNEFRIKEAYVGWQGLKEYFTVRGGAMKVPWSQEETTSSRFIDFAERSLLNRLAPSFDTGLWFHGSFADKLFSWVLAAYNGNGNQTADANDEKGVAARLMVSPFVNAAGPFATLRFGVDVALDSIDDDAGDTDTITTGDLGGVTVIDLGAPVDGSRERLLFNLSWNSGPFSIRGEYAIVTQELADGAPASDFDITAFYIQATYLLTGEDKPLENRVKPKHNFHPLKGTWGAWELAARFARIDASDADDLVAAGTNTEVSQVTLGVNWWWAPNVALRINWEHLMFDEDLPIGTGDSLEDAQDIFYVRWQIDF